MALMKITFACSQCHATNQQTFTSDTVELTCPSCGTLVRLTEGAVRGNRVDACLVCPSRELFVRKDFPQRLGVAIVVVGFGLSSVAWYYHWILLTYGILFLTALIDVALFLWMGDVLECYRCHAQYRDVENLTEHTPFDLEVHEKHRQQQARLAASPGPPQRPEA